MSFAKANLGLRGAATRALAIAFCGVALAGCDTLSSLNPFDKGETYKPEIVIVRAGSVDGDPGVRPQMHIWVGAKAPWYDIHDSLPRHAEGAPAS